MTVMAIRFYESDKWIIIYLFLQQPLKRQLLP